MKPFPPFQSKAVSDVFDGFSVAQRATLLNVRQLVFAVAKTTDGVGTLDETLKWGQPSYLTHSPKSGTTIRLGVSKAGAAALYVHCQTTLIADFEQQYPNDFTYDGTRALYLEDDSDQDALAVLIARALTYHKR